jgi:hypothetical protein
VVVVLGLLIWINNTAFTSDANGNLFLDTASGGITNGINIRSIGTVARLYINFYTSGVNTFQYLTTADTVKLALLSGTVQLLMYLKMVQK